MDVNAMCDVEDILGCPITELGDTMGMREMRVVLFCSLRWEDKKLTMTQTGRSCRRLYKKKVLIILGRYLERL